MKKLLIVEDDEMIVLMTKRVLTKSIKDIEVLTAENGKVGLDIYEKNQDISIIITDVNMEVMDGITMVKTLEDQYNNLPSIYIMSAFPANETEASKLKSCKHYFEKFVSKEDFLSVFKEKETDLEYY